MRLRYFAEASPPACGSSAPTADLTNAAADKPRHASKWKQKRQVSYKLGRKGRFAPSGEPCSGATMPCPRVGMDVRRRDFIAALGAATAWPVVARGQSTEPIRRVGVLMNLAADDPVGKKRQSVFEEELRERGWEIGRNIQVDIRWAAGIADRYRSFAAELVALKPDVLVAATSPSVRALQSATRTIPIVFASVLDPVASGFVATLARPGGNTTGFALFEYGLSGKWLALLKEIGPQIKRVAVLRAASDIGSMGQLGGIQNVAPSFGVELTILPLRDVAEIDHDVANFARGEASGLIVTASPYGATHSGPIAAIAAKYRLPAVYPFRYFVQAGGLASYGPDGTKEFGPAAAYVDRILKGAKASELPVQEPNKYDLVVSLKAAKAIGLTLSPTILVRADEVIE